MHAALLQLQAQLNPLTFTSGLSLHSIHSLSQFWSLFTQSQLEMETHQEYAYTKPLQQRKILFQIVHAYVTTL